MTQQLTLTAGTSRLTAVVDHRRPIRVGDRVTLADAEDPSQLWDVVAAHDLPRPVPRGWNNNI